MLGPDTRLPQAPRPSSESNLFEYKDVNLSNNVPGMVRPQMPHLLIPHRTITATLIIHSLNISVPLATQAGNTVPARLRTSS